MNNPFSSFKSLGFDLSNFSLKIVELKKEKKELKLTFFENFLIPEGIIEGGEIKKEKELTEILKGVRNKIKVRDIIVSLPEEKLFLDIIQLPLMNEKEVKKTIQFEIENYIPFPIEEVYFDFEKIEFISDRPKYQEILITAFSKKIIDTYLKALKNVDFQPIVLEPECFSITRALIKKDRPSEFILILDLGENRTGFTLFFGKNVRFTSTLPFSSRQLTKALVEELKITFEEAEKIKKEQGIEKESQIKEILNPFLFNLIKEIKNLLEYYSTHNPKIRKQFNEISLEKILLCGGGANLKGLTEFLSSELKIKVEKGNPWINILKEPIKEIPELSFEESLSYTTSLGLALQPIYGD